jgi:F-type H+-transporting ATPase subunit gamma
MPSLKTLKNRIKSIKSTQKITKAMKMVAAAKLKRAREQAEASAPYADLMNSLLTSIANSIICHPSPYKLLSGNGQDKNYLVIVISSDKGLCGAFNSNIYKMARVHIEKLLKQGKNVKILCLGQKVHNLLRKRYSNLLLKKIELKSNANFDDAEKVAALALDKFEQGSIDVCQIIFNKFKSIINQEVTLQQLIPLASKADKQEVFPYEYEPSEEIIVNKLLLKNIKTQLFRALLDSQASELSARMTAMDNASRNAGQIIDKLRLVYNRTRQAHITKELIEIISGAEAI